MKTIDDLTRWIESQYPVGESTDRALAVTGEPYVVIGWEHPEQQVSGWQQPIPGVVREGERHLAARSEKHALWNAKNAFRLHAKGRRGILYWRIRPDLDHSGGFYGVYMRLLISDNPVIKRAA